MYIIMKKKIDEIIQRARRITYIKFTLARRFWKT